MSVNTGSLRWSRVGTLLAVCAAVVAIAIVSATLGGRSAGGGSQPAATVASEEPSASPSVAGEEPLSEEKPLDEGEAAADDAAAEATTEIVSEAGRTQTGAVEAFVTYTTWVIASPAAEEDPTQTSEALGGELNSADAAMVESIERSGGLDYEPSVGAYRVLGFSGNENAPDAVMLEVVAPMTVQGEILWKKIGGVMSWQHGQWLPTSLRPTEIEQPSAPTLAIAEMSEDDRSLLLEGLGWELFSNSPTPAN